MQHHYNPSLEYLYKLQKELTTSQNTHHARPDHPAFVSAPLEELQEEASVTLYLSTDYPAHVDEIRPVTTTYHIEYDVNDLWSFEEHFRLQTDIARATGLAPISSTFTRNQQHLVDERRHRFALYCVERITLTPQRIPAPLLDNAIQQPQLVINTTRNTTMHRYPLRSLDCQATTKNVDPTSRCPDLGRDLARRE